MVGLSDIPCLGIALDRVSEATIDVSIRGLRYMLCYKAIVNDLENQINLLEIDEVAVAIKVDAEVANGKTIEQYVSKWQKEVEYIKTRADKLSRQIHSRTCFKVLHFPDPVSRFRLGRKGAHLAKHVNELTVSSQIFLRYEIAYLPAIEDVPLSDTIYQKFDSREEAYQKLLEALTKEDGHTIIGIYGMPGVGKTLMIEQACKQVKDKMIFHRVARVAVGGGKLDPLELQGHLARLLKFHLKSEDEVERACELKNYLMDGGKTLLILDDVWDVIHLNKIGIPFGNPGYKDCKIIFSSRIRHVCLDNHCKDPIEIKTLAEDEAWEMFNNTVGTSKIESLSDAFLAKKVCRECAAMPLLIHAVGKALEFVGENSWKEAHYQLENGKFEVIDGRTAQVYACLLTSFEKLTDEEKTCLLLCSLFPQDANIEIKMLFDLSTGSQILERGTNIHGLIDNLKSSSLLLQGKDDYNVKIHDIIRDVARSIAARDPKYAFLYAKCKKWLPDIADYPTLRLLRLDLEGENVRFPDDLVCSDLHTLWLQCNSIHSQKYLGGFLKAFKNLKFLLLKGISSSKQQLSIRAMEKLSVLILDGCDVDEIFLASIPKNIETLRIRECNIPTPDIYQT